MDRKPGSIASCVFALLPGWIFLLGGLMLLGMVLLTPSWLANRELGWQRDLLRLQSERLTQQEERYQHFQQALLADDPVLLERLAYAQFRFKPVNRQLLEQPALDPAATTRLAAHAAGAEAGAGSLVSASVDDWLRAPLPRIGKDLPRQLALSTRLTRMTAGVSRIGLLVVGLASLAVGLYSSPRRSRW
jgi:hypothetical protein